MQQLFDSHLRTQELHSDKRVKLRQVWRRRQHNANSMQFSALKTAILDAAMHGCHC